MKNAHITSRPNHQLGDKVISLCGKEFKVKVLWRDLPEEHPVCRTCIDYAITALTQADNVIEASRRRLLLLTLSMERLQDELTPDESLMLDDFADRDKAHRLEQDTKREAKAARKLAKSTCSCTWKSMEDFVIDPNCPIHGEPAVGEVVEEEPTDG